MRYAFLAEFHDHEGAQTVKHDISIFSALFPSIDTPQLNEYSLKTAIDA